MRRVVALLSCAIVTLAACSSPLEPGEGSRSRLGGPRAAGKAHDKGDKNGHGGKKEDDAIGNTEGTAPPPDAVPDVPGTDSDDKTSSNSLEPPGEASDVDPSLARASSTVEEPEADAEKQGITPGYAEVYVARIEGLGKQLRMSMEVGGDVPDRMPDDHTYMTFGFALLMGGDEAYSFGAYADQNGWKTFAGGKGREGSEFPGTFELNGREIVMTVPWSYVRGPRSFKWQANSGWFTQIANQTHYAFDVVPNKNGARFPGS